MDWEELFIFNDISADVPFIGDFFKKEMNHSWKLAEIMLAGDYSSAWVVERPTFFMIEWLVWEPSIWV